MTANRDVRLSGHTSVITFAEPTRVQEPPSKKNQNEGWYGYHPGPVSFSLTRDSAVEGELRHIGVGSPKRLFGRLVGAIKEVWVHIIPLQGGGRGRR